MYVYLVRPSFALRANVTGRLQVTYVPAAYNIAMMTSIQRFLFEITFHRMRMRSHESSQVIFMTADRMAHRSSSSYEYAVVNFKLVKRLLRYG